MAAENPEIIILSSSDEESKPQTTMQFSKKQKKSGNLATQVKNNPQVQSRYSSKSQAVNIMKQAMMSKNGTRIISVPVHKNQNIIVGKRISHNVHNSAKSKMCGPSQLQIAVSAKSAPQKNNVITKSVLSSKNSTSKNNVVAKISSQPVVRTSTPKSSTQNPPFLKFGSNISITPKSTEVRSQNSNEITVSPSVISALEKKGISVTNVYEDNISQVQNPKRTAPSQNYLRDMKNKLIKSHVNMDVVPKTNNASSCVNSALNSNKLPQASTQSLKRKYPNQDAVEPNSAPSAKKVANYSNRNSVNLSSSQYIKMIPNSSKNLSTSPVKNIPLKNSSEIKIVEKRVMFSNSPKKPSNMVQPSYQIRNSKNNCFVPKTYMKRPEKAPSISSSQQTFSNRQVSIYPTRSSQTNLAKENSAKFLKTQSSQISQKKSVLNLEATDLKNSLDKKIDNDLIVCYSSFPPANLSKKSVQNSDVTKLPTLKVPDSKIPFKQTTLDNCITQSPITDCKKIDLSKDRSALLGLLALCDTHSNSSSKKATSFRKPVKKNLNAAVTVIPVPDKPLSSYKQKNNVIVSMKLHEIKDRTRNWPKLVVSLEKLNIGAKYANKSLSSEPIIKALESNNEITIEKEQLIEEVNCPKPSCSQLSSSTTKSLVSCSNSKAVLQSVDKDVSAEVKSKGLQNPAILKNSHQNHGSVTISLNKPINKCTNKVLPSGLTIETVNLSGSNHKHTIKKSESNNEITIEKKQLIEEVNHPKPSCSQLSSSTTKSLVSCSNSKAVHQSVDKDVSAEVKNKGFQNHVILKNSQENQGSVTFSLNKPVNKCTNKVLPSGLTIETVNLSDSNHKHTIQKSELNRELKSSNSNASQLSTNIINEQVESSSIKILPRAIDSSGLVKVQNKKLENITIFESTHQNKNSHIDKDTNKILPTKTVIKTIYLSDDKKISLSTEKKLTDKIETDSNDKKSSVNVANKQVEHSNTKELNLQPINIDLAKDKHILNSVVSESAHQSKKPDANASNSQAGADMSRNISMKPIIKTSNSGSDEKIQLSKGLKSFKEIQMNSKFHTDSNNSLLSHHITHNPVESSDLKFKQQAFDLTDSSKIKETHEQNSHQNDGPASDFNKHGDTCVDKKLSNQLVVEILNLSDSDSKLHNKKVKINEKLEPTNDAELSAIVLTKGSTECSKVNSIQQAVDNVISLPYAEEASNLSDSDSKHDNEMQVNEEPSNGIELSANVTNSVIESPNVNSILLSVDNVISLPDAEEASNLSDSDSKHDHEMQVNEELEPSDGIELSANVTYSAAECTNVGSIQQAVGNVIASSNAEEVSSINEQVFRIFENSQSNCYVMDTFKETKDISNLKSNNNNVLVNSSSKDNICDIVNSPITSMISSDSSCFSLNKDIKMTLIDKPHNLSHTETLNKSNVDYDMLDKSVNNTTKNLDEEKNSEFSEIVKEPALVSLSPDVSFKGDFSYNSASVIVKNLLRIIISNVEELNNENNSMRSKILKVTEDSNSLVQKRETKTKVNTNSVKSKSEDVAEKKESKISNILDSFDSKSFVVNSTLEEGRKSTKLHSNKDLLLCSSTSKGQDSENENVVDQVCKKPLCSDIDSDSQLSITAVAVFPCTEAGEKSCSEALSSSADKKNNEFNIKILSVMSAQSSGVANDINNLSVTCLPSSGVANEKNSTVDDNLNYKLKEIKSATADNDKGKTNDDETRNEISDQHKNVMSECENDRMGFSKHILDFQDGNNISSPLHADEGLSYMTANVESKRDTVAEIEQKLEFSDESELRENLFNEDEDSGNIDSDDQVIATGLKSLSSEESTSNVFAPAVTEDEQETLNQSCSKQVTSPKLSLKRNRSTESPNHAVEKTDGVKRTKLLDSSLSSDVIQEQNSSNFSLIPFDISTDEKNKKRFKELLEFSKTLMEETSQTEKEKIVKNMVKKLNETQLWYAGSEKFSSLIDATRDKLSAQNSHENVFSVLQDVRKEFKKYKCKFKPTVIKENNADTNSAGSFLSIKISAVEGNTDSSSMADMHYRPKKRPSLFDGETDNFSNLKQGVNGFTLNSVSSLPDIDFLPAKCTESSSNDCKIESDIKSTSFHSALEETLKNLDSTADKAILDLKSIALASSSQNFNAEEEASSVLQGLAKSPLSTVHEDRTSVRNLCASPPLQSHSSVLDSSLTTNKKDVKSCSSASSFNFEPVPSCSYNADNSNSSASLQNVSSERTSNKKPDWDGGTSLSIKSCISVDKIKDTLSVLKDEKSIKEIIHEPENSRQQRRIERLEKQLEKLDRRIKKLQEKELTLDDLDDEESAYVLEDKYLKRFKQVWDTLCKLKKQPSRTGRIIEKKFKYEGTRYKEINQAVEKMINKRKGHEKFPDFVEVLTLVKKVNEKDNIGLNERAVSIEAERVFKDIGRELQIRRMRDHEELFGCHLTDGIDLDNDPAEHDEELKKVLKANSHKFEESINKVIDTYAEKQKKMPMGEDNENDKDSSDNEDDVPEVEEVDKEDLPMTDPGSDTSGSDKKTQKDLVEIVYDSDKSTDPNEETKAKETVKQEPPTVTNKSNIVVDVIDLGHDSDSMDLPSIQELMSSR